MNETIDIIESNKLTTTIKIPLVEANLENIKNYGEIFGDDVYKPGLAIPFYKGRVLEGENIDFKYFERAVIRTAKILPGFPKIKWLERHVRMTQLFVGLGSEPFIMVLAPPNHESGGIFPDISKTIAFKFKPGHALLLKYGTWHDFPIADQKAVVVMTANSAEVVEALISMKTPGEMNFGDVFKINLEQGAQIELEIDEN